RREAGGGVILDAIHELDYLGWILGPVATVNAAVAARLSDLDIDVEDYACLALRHASGTVSEIHLDYLRPYKRRGCELVGEDGMLLWQSEGKNPEICSVRLFRRDRDQWETLHASDSLDGNEPYRLMLGRFIAGGEQEWSLLLDGRQALRELEVALEARARAGAGAMCCATS
ncbi:MAG: Gfo/Idh/MocA family oxidoreductase, partial [Thermodesulfobacteriota bacterium]